MKPIPTLMTPLETVKPRHVWKSKEASKERSDTCAVPACAVVAESEVAFVLAEAYPREVTGAINMADIKAAVESVPPAAQDDGAMRHEASRRTSRGGGACAPRVSSWDSWARGRRRSRDGWRAPAGVASVDMDTYLERREGKRVKEKSSRRRARDGFRAIETDVLRELAGKEPLLVSCGGGRGEAR